MPLMHHFGLFFCNISREVNEVYFASGAWDILIRILCRKLWKIYVISCLEGPWRSLSWLNYVLRITECDTSVKCNQITSPPLQKISQPLYQVEANPIKCLKTFVQRISISNLSRFVITKEAVAWLIPENWISRGIWARREHWALPFLLQTPRKGGSRSAFTWATCLLLMENICHMSEFIRLFQCPLLGSGMSSFLKHMAQWGRLLVSRPFPIH